MIWSGLGSSPGITSSSPVAMSATSGRRRTGTDATFIDASSARSAGRRRRGAHIACPAWKSQPAARMLSPAPMPSPSVMAAPSRVTSSCMITRVAPSGTGAPVKMRTASPVPTVPPKPCPAAASPITLSTAPGAGLSAIA